MRREKIFLVAFAIVAMLFVSGCHKDKTYVVTFDANGGTGTMKEQKFDEGVEQALSANSFTRDGYSFSKWNTVKDGSGTSYTDGQKITATADMTLYAQWTDNSSSGSGSGSGSGTAISGFNSNGASNATFSVSATQEVRFSRGNLQYQASTDTWRFAENQYDRVGSDNIHISSTNADWIDLFGYGTSGWNSGASAYQPYSSSNSYSAYIDKDLTGNYAEADWGVHNAISNGGNQAGMWRTPTRTEWSYLLFNRSASTVNGTDNARYAKAVVNGVNGLILFPDSYTHPSDVDAPVNINISGVSYNGNTYGTAHFEKMQSAGAIFLPCTGKRNSGQIMDVNDNGYYWSSTGKYYYTFNTVNVTSNEALASQHQGHSVRLIQDKE